MSHRCLSVVLAGAVAFALADFTITAAQSADAPSGVTIVYGVPPVEPLLPPVGYTLDPSDARRPIYVVNQGPVYSGPGIITFATPTYSEGGYAYALPYPYVRGYGGYGWYDAPGYRGWPRRHGYGRSVIRPYAAAYRYRSAPNARVINLLER
jgi:hypothetical protein